MTELESEPNSKTDTFIIHGKLSFLEVRQVFYKKIQFLSTPYQSRI